MKKPASRLLLFLAAIAIGGVLLAPDAQAADGADKAANKKKKEDADLRKYDKNQNGKLDPDEKAALEADLKKAKEKKKKKADQET